VLLEVVKGIVEVMFLAAKAVLLEKHRHSSQNDLNVKYALSLSSLVQFCRLW
jgi:hypothetical protein